MTATTRPPVSEFIREITRATEEDRKRRYSSLSNTIKYYPILSMVVKPRYGTKFTQGGEAAKTKTAWKPGIWSEFHCRFHFFKAEQCGKSDPLGVLGELNSILEKEEERFISISAKLIDLTKTKWPKHLHWWHYLSFRIDFEMEEMDEENDDAQLIYRDVTFVFVE